MRSASPATVLHVILPQPAPAVGGSERLVLDLATAMEGRPGWRSAIATFGNAAYLAEVRSRGVPAIDHRRVFRWGSVRSVARFAIDHDVGIIHGHGYGADYFTALLRTALRGRGHEPKTVMTVHGIVRSTRRQRLMTRFDFAAHRLAADAVMVCSRAQQQEVDERCGRPTWHIPHSVRVPPPTDRSSRDNESTGGERVVAFIGRLSPEKDPLLFVRMAGVLVSVLGSVRFILVGHGPLAANVDQYVEQQGLAGRMERVPQTSDVYALLNEIDVLANTSHTEATPRVVLEALATGVPVVAPNVGDVSEILGQGRFGLIVNDRGAENIAAAVKTVLGALPAFRRRAMEGRRHVEQHYSIDRLVNRAEAMYTSLLSSPTADTHQPPTPTS